ncbi:hypothetical protein RD110_07970 [Rhodoferax koreense]|uniref:Uncharacterized protein n=1 Tax=Rhodoferax koreensis TaxID=1842727 RepID=A0A1P8JTP6_9BURK|nr:hypothetical protein [Rhodoferax koreense]APW37140.1 hypothetical protein RD110_07970 [Rhodoferax koreense]
MKLQVYRLREKGRRLPGGEVERRGPEVGEFMYERNNMRGRTFKALLVRPGDMKNFHVIPLLDEAVILKVDSQGMLIAGREFVSNGVRKHQNNEYRQSWWCVLPQGATTPPAPLETPPQA